MAVLKVGCAESTAHPCDAAAWLVMRLTERMQQRHCTHTRLVRSAHHILKNIYHECYAYAAYLEIPATVFSAGLRRESEVLAALQRSHTL